jgi:hypothetical protein
VNKYKSAKYWSDYTNDIEGYNFEPDDPEEPEDPEASSNAQILYTSSDGNIVTPSDSSAFDVNIVSNTYENGQGTITFDGDVTMIKSSAFKGCATLTSITIPNSVTTVQASAFQNCTSLTSVTIPDGVTTMAGTIFSGCTNLETAIIGDGLATLGYQVFYNCSNLTNLTIGSGVTSLGGMALSGCKNLTSITCKANKAPSTASNSFGTGSSTYTGYNTRGQNKLYVYSNATGYNSGGWSSPLCDSSKCGFTLSKTL